MNQHIIKGMEIGVAICVLLVGITYLYNLQSGIGRYIAASNNYHRQQQAYTQVGDHVQEKVNLDELYYVLMHSKMQVYIDGNRVLTYMERMDSGLSGNSYQVVKAIQEEVGRLRDGSYLVSYYHKGTGDLTGVYYTHE